MKMLRTVAFLAIGFNLVACSLVPGSIFDPGTQALGGGDRVAVALHLNRSGCIQGGEKVIITMKIVNNSNKDIILQAENKPVADIVVVNPLSKTTIISWATQNPNDVSTTLSLSPNEAKSYELVWNTTEGPYPKGFEMHISGLVNEGTKVQNFANLAVCMRPQD